MSYAFSKHLDLIQTKVGITRVSDVTKLDALGLPVVQCFRPLSKNYIVSQGKGRNKEAAKISAMMESIEFYHGENIVPEFSEKLEIMGPRLKYNVNDLTLTSELSPDQILTWVSADSLIHRQKTWLPFDLISLNFSSSRCSNGDYFRNTSNGYGGGSTKVQATLHGLFEVIERHQISVGEKVRINIDSEIVKIFSPFIQSFAKYKIRVGVYAFLNSLSIPTFKVVLFESDKGIAFSGSACHWDKNIALEKAFIEALQSRLTHFTASRDDLAEDSFELKDSLADNPKQEALRQFSFEAIESLFSGPQSNEYVLEHVLLYLKNNGFSEVIVKDLSSSEINIPVCVVVVPKMKFSWEHIL